MSATCIVIIGAIAAIVAAFGGAALGAYFAYNTGMKLVRETHKNAVELLRQQEFSNARFLFINAFMDELNLLELTSKDAYAEILRPASSKHITAVYIFRQVIHDKNRLAAFDKAWEEYYKNEHQPDSPLRQYSTQLPQTDNFLREKRRPLAITRIKALLKFAE